MLPSHLSEGFIKFRQIFELHGNHWILLDFEDYILPNIFLLRNTQLVIKYLKDTASHCS